MEKEEAVPPGRRRFWATVGVLIAFVVAAISVMGLAMWRTAAEEFLVDARALVEFFRGFR